MIDTHFIDGAHQTAGTVRDVEVVSQAATDYASGQPVTLSETDRQLLQSQYPGRFINGASESHARDVYRRTGACTPSHYPTPT